MQNMSIVRNLENTEKYKEENKLAPNPTVHRSSLFTLCPVSFLFSLLSSKQVTLSACPSSSCFRLTETPLGVHGFPFSQFPRAETEPCFVQVFLTVGASVCVLTLVHELCTFYLALF